MIPVPNQKLAIKAWNLMVKTDCHPCGVLVYTGDTLSAVATYMRASGLETTDGLFTVEAGHQYAFIATDTPTDSWCAYAESLNLLWWQWFGASFNQWQNSQSATATPSSTPNAAPTTEDTEEAEESDQVVIAVEHELMAHPTDQIGSQKDRKRILIGRLQVGPGWLWYYETPYPIAKIFGIHTNDVPSLKIRISTRDKTGRRFALGNIPADQLAGCLQDIAVHPEFKRIVQGYRP